MTNTIGYNLGYGLVYWAWFLFIGAVIGWVAGNIIRGRGFGIFADIVIGIVGAAIGGWASRVIGMHTHSTIVAFLMAIAGAVILVGLTRLVEKKAAA